MAKARQIKRVIKRRARNDNARNERNIKKNRRYCRYG